jgi:hypothetical protein
MNTELNNLKAEIENLTDLIEANPNEVYDEKFYELESKLEQIKDYQFNDFDYKVLKNIQKRLKAISKDLDIYDEPEERESMFPDGEDD